MSIETKLMELDTETLIGIVMAGVCQPDGPDMIDMIAVWFEYSDKILSELSRRDEPLDEKTNKIFDLPPNSTTKNLAQMIKSESYESVKGKLLAHSFVSLYHRMVRKAEKRFPKCVSPIVGLLYWIGIGLGCGVK